MNKDNLQIEFSEPIKELHKKLDRFFWILLSVGVVFVITLLIMVATLIIDSFHINSATYKEYSQKTESVEMTQKINQELLEQNKKNQELIIKQQNQILELLNKK
ncbi:MAG: hypothetical protein V3T98_02660 [Candidatus Paceibacterota bacterium]